MRHGRKTVMIVDDDPDFRELLNVYLSIKGFDTERAEDCAEALKIFARIPDRIDVVLLDYYMPGMLPCDCVSRLMGYCGDKIPIVLLTAAVDASLRAQELKLPHFVSKPFNVEKLANLLDAILHPDVRLETNHSSRSKALP